MVYIQLMKEKIAREGISAREAARQIGFSNTSLKGILSGRPPTVKTLKMISAWLGVPISILLSETGDDFLALAVQTLRDTPIVAEILRKGGNLVENGTITEEIFHEWIEFLAFELFRKNAAPAGFEASIEILLLALQ